MKKAILKAFAVLAVLSCASLSYASGGTITSTGTSIGTQSFKPSNNVSIKIYSSSTLTNNRYSAESGHGSGDRVFGTNSVDPKMYWKSVTSGTPVDATNMNIAADNVDFTTGGWTSL